ncbi:MAG TPA: M60 family metallopeptidase, partial [Chitinophaga sp.]|nr:M60 family metallopeptidase [Chitinophaga sp.]
LLFGRKMEKEPGAYYVAPAGKVFPGEVSPSASRVSGVVTIPVKTGAEGLWEPESPYYVRQSTGLYVPAGEKVTIITGRDYADQHLKIQVGAHDDRLFHMDHFVREPYNLTSSFDIVKDTTEVYSPYGGILYLSVPDTSHLKAVTLNIGGAVRYPYFKSGVTKADDWKNTIRSLGAPWAELATDKIIITVPAERIRNLEDPEKLMRFWDEVLDADAALAHIPAARLHPERIIIDKQVAFGYMFTTSEKIVAPDGPSCINMLDESYMRIHGSWGHFHELGHRHQFWGIDFHGLGEVTVNLYSMYVFDKVLGKGIYNHDEISGKEAVINKVKRYMAEGADFKKWSEDPFLALCMYIEIIEGFGWPAIEKVFQGYRALPQGRYPSTEEEKRDYWFKMICNATQKNLSVFFDKWAVPVSDSAKKEVAGLPEWLPEELK